MAVSVLPWLDVAAERSTSIAILGYRRSVASWAQCGFFVTWLLKFCTKTAIVDDDSAGEFGVVAAGTSQLFY